MPRANSLCPESYWEVELILNLMTKTPSVKIHDSIFFYQSKLSVSNSMATAKTSDEISTSVKLLGVV